MADEIDHGGQAPIFDMKVAREKFRAAADTSKGARRARHKKASNAADGRTLRSTGRTEHLNYKARPQIRAFLAEHVGKGNISRWLEEAIIAKAKEEGIEIDA
jgi:hypothetical protein